MAYSYRFDYDGGNRNDDGRFVADMPHVLIVAPDGTDIIEVFEEPLTTVASPDIDDAHWRLPDESLAMRVLTFLNENA